jgi:hypothetical protein
MRLKSVLVLATIGAFSAIGVAVAAPAPTLNPNTSNLLMPIHGCHPYYEWGWVREWGTKARHRHSQRYDCVPRGGGGGGYYEDRGYRRGGDWDRGGGPPRGWRPGGYAPGCMKVGPVWYCPPD